MSIREPVILNQPISELPFSNELKNILEGQMHKTLKDVLEKEVNHWHAYPKFSFHHLKEIMEFAEKNHLSEYIKQR